MVTQTFNTVIEEMQTWWAKHKRGGPKGAQVAPGSKCTVTPNYPCKIETVQESLDKLGAQVQRLSMAVTDLHADQMFRQRTVRPATLCRQPWWAAS